MYLLTNTSALIVAGNTSAATCLQQIWRSFILWMEQPPVAELGGLP